MSGGVNRRITLAARPGGYPQETNFRLTEAPVPRPERGEVLVRTLWLSLDPYQRGRMSTAKSYAPPVEVGEVMIGGIVGRVVESRNQRFTVGDIVEGWLGRQDYALSDGHDIRKVDPTLAPISTALGVLGMPGMTAYFGLLEIGQPKPGDTVVVSAASGAVGAVVGQIAKLTGCRVVGTAGSPDKVAYITGELGYDAGIDYKSEDVDAALARACPNGVDVYFDNVGGAVTDAVFRHLADRARIVICGQISQYNLAEPELGPRNLRFLLVHQARVEGFLVFRFASRYGEAIPRLAGWIAEGKLKYREDVVEGLENAPSAFVKLMRGENFGKLLVKVAET
jgi:NADPH-dependent curcumin reductase CurA